MHTGADHAHWHVQPASLCPLAGGIGKTCALRSHINAVLAVSECVAFRIQCHCLLADARSLLMRMPGSPILTLDPNCVQAFLDTMKRRGVSFLEMLAMEMKVNAPARLCASMPCIHRGQGQSHIPHNVLAMGMKARSASAWPCASIPCIHSRQDQSIIPRSLCSTSGRTALYALPPLLSWLRTTCVSADDNFDT